MSKRLEMARIFRIRWPVRAACMAALVSWLGIAAVALTAEGLPFASFAAIVFFVSFFMFWVRYYFRLRYVINEYGIILMGPGIFSHIDWDEIERIDPSGIPSGGYLITTRHGGFLVNGFVERHQALMELIVTRAGLFPLHS